MKLMRVDEAMEIIRKRREDETLLERTPFPPAYVTAALEKYLKGMYCLEEGD